MSDRLPSGARSWPSGVGEATEPPAEHTELAALVARSTLIGADPTLVLHGGGNTSAKGTVRDHLGRVTEVLWVKGSGADLYQSTAADYPALRLADLLPLRHRTGMADEEMVDAVTRALLDPGARRPSVETLLHAFLPYRHVDHVHADAICALTMSPHAPQVTAEALGEGFAYVDWLRPGFALSSVVADLADRDGIVLAHHGLVVWADTSEECYQRTVATVARAAEYLDAQGRRRGVTARSSAVDSGNLGDVPVGDMPVGDVPAVDEELRTLLLRLRGRLSRDQRRILYRDSRLAALTTRSDLASVVAAGVSSADHMLRIGTRSLVISADPQAAEAAIDHHEQQVQAVQQRHRDLLPLTGGHEPLPRVLLLREVGAITTGLNPAEARIRADIATRTHASAAMALDAFGSALPLGERDTVDFDYWPLELYKLTLRPPPRPLAGSIVIVTGAGSGIGRAIAEHLAAVGACLVLADLNAMSVSAVADSLAGAPGGRPEVVIGDQSDPTVAANTIHAAIDAFGGVDGVVLNAGIGVTGRITDLTDEQWERALRVNLTSAFLLTRAALRALTAQGIGGSLVYIASKNAFAPGAGFGAYSASKAAMIQLMRIAALEGGAAGIRANAVNPDAVFDNSGLWDERLRSERAAAHGIEPEQLADFYAGRTLLRQPVTTVNVAQTVGFLLSEESSRTTGAVLPVDSGVAAAFPR